MIKQVYLPVTRKVNEIERSFAQHDPVLRERIEKERQEFLKTVADAEVELNTYFRRGFLIVSHFVFEGKDEQFVHFVLYRDDIPDF